MSDKEFMDRLNQLFQNVARDLELGYSQPACRYYSNKDVPRLRFCWNTEPLTPTLDTKNRKWATWVERVYKHKAKRYKFRYCATRTTAKRIADCRLQSAKSRATRAEYV